jgi:hypothetical protein
MTMLFGDAVNGQRVIGPEPCTQVLLGNRSIPGNMGVTSATLDFHMQDVRFW